MLRHAGNCVRVCNIERACHPLLLFCVCGPAGKDWKSSEAAHEARVAVELGLRPGRDAGNGEGLAQSVGMKGDREDSMHAWMVCAFLGGGG
jgi:hypothetical protein